MIKKIFDLLKDKQISNIIYMVYVFGSKEGYHFRQAELESFFASPEAGKNGSVRSKFKLIDGLFIEIDKNNKHPFHCCDGHPEIEESNGEYKYKIRWTQKTTIKGCPIRPSFKWLKELYDIELTLDQTQELLKYFQMFSEAFIEEDKFNKDFFPGVANTNIIEIFANSLELSYIMRYLGQSFFGDNFENARLELREERKKFKPGDNYDGKFKSVCEKYGVNLNKYNEGLITMLTIFNFGIVEDFPQIKNIVPAQNLRYEYGNPLLYTISDVLIMSFMGIDQEDSNDQIIV